MLLGCSEDIGAVIGSCKEPVHLETAFIASGNNVDAEVATGCRSQAHPVGGA